MLKQQWAGEGFLAENPYVTQGLNARAAGKIEVLQKLLEDPEVMFETVSEESDGE